MKTIMVKVGGKEYPTIIDEKGVQRFIQNKLLWHLVEVGIIDLNKVYKEFKMNKVSKKISHRDYTEFIMSLGYSVDGFSELKEFWKWKIENPLKLENKN